MKTSIHPYPSRTWVEVAHKKYYSYPKLPHFIEKVLGSSKSMEWVSVIVVSMFGPAAPTPTSEFVSAYPESRW